MKPLSISILFHGYARDNVYGLFRYVISRYVNQALKAIESMTAFIWMTLGA